MTGERPGLATAIRRWSADEAGRARMGRWALWLAIGATILVCYPALGDGFIADDFVFLYRLESHAGGEGPVLDLFSFGHGISPMTQHPIDVSEMPWWYAPQLAVRFFRPLSSVLFQLDHSLFGLRALGYHVHSLAWYLALLGACSLILRRCTSAPVAALTLVMFALDAHHCFAISHLANRHACTSTVLGCIALWGHVRWREERWTPGRWIFVLAQALGLAAGETALELLAYVAAYEGLCAPGDRRERLAELIPAAAMGGGYLALYRAARFGAPVVSSWYVDPMGDTLTYARTLPTRLLELVGAQVLQICPDLWMSRPWVEPALLAAGALTLMLGPFLLAGALRRVSDGQGRPIGWLLWGALLSLVPATAARTSSRLLLVPSLGLTVGIALLILDGLDWSTASATAGTPGRHARRFVAAMLATIHLGLAPLMLRVHLGFFDQAKIAAVWQPVVGGMLRVHPQGKRLYVLAGPAWLQKGFTPWLLSQIGGALPATWRLLSPETCALRVARIGPLTLEIASLGTDGTPVADVWGLDAQYWAPGRTCRVDGLMVTIRSVSGGRPGVVRFEFDRPLDTADVVFLTYRSGALHPVELPAVGRSIELPPWPAPDEGRSRPDGSASGA